MKKTGFLSLRSSQWQLVAIHPPWPLLTTSAAENSLSFRISYSHAQARHAADAQLIPSPSDQTPTHRHSSGSKASDEYRNISCEPRRPATYRPR
jgi:hypothetical protein